MSKIPYVDFENEPGEGTPEEKRKAFIKSNLISGSILALIAILIGVLVYISLINRQNPEPAPRIIFHILADGFSIAGILGLLFFLMSYVSSRGTFDILSYAMKALFFTTFRPKYKKENFPKTYYDYKVLKDKEERKAYSPILIPSAIYFALGIIFVIIYMANAELL